MFQIRIRSNTRGVLLQISTIPFHPGNYNMFASETTTLVFPCIQICENKGSETICYQKYSATTDVVS